MEGGAKVTSVRQYRQIYFTLCLVHRRSSEIVSPFSFFFPPHVRKLCYQSLAKSYFIQPLTGKISRATI